MTMIYPYIVYIYSKYINNNTYSIIHMSMLLLAPQM